MIEAAYSRSRRVRLPGQLCRVAWARQVGTHVPHVECRGTVMQVYSRACTIALNDRGIVVLLAPSVGMVAHGIRLIEPLAFEDAARPGNHVWLEPERLIVGRSLTVCHRAVEAWEPEFKPGMSVSPLASETAAALRELSDGGEVLDCVLGRGGRSALYSAVMLALPAIAAAVRCADAQAALGAISGLLGLGPGLTPSGDDFIVGLLAGMSIGAMTPKRHAFLRALCSGVADMAARTTPVSCQHLRDASDLGFSERLSDVCFAIVRGVPRGVLLRRAAAQLAVGATSGGDAMAGLVFALFDCGALSATTTVRGG